MLRNMMRGFLRFLITLAVILGLAYGTYLFAMHTIEVHTNVAIDEDATGEDYFLIEIETGMRATDVLEILHEEGLIRNDTIANLLVRVNRWQGIRTGGYHVHAGMSLAEMFDLFNGGGIITVPVIHVIIPEGILITRIAELFGETLEIDSDDLLELWSDVAFLEELIEEYWFLTDEILNPELHYPLEGYITPIRHEIPEGEEDLREITRAILSMTERMWGYQNLQGRIGNTDLTVHEVLSFAAIIQGETGRVDQMEDISGIFWNRIALDMLWQSDVSAQYLLPERVEEVLYEHLDIDSPFNTYQYPGIPVGPMNTPSVQAILAVMNPADHDYIFFITDMFGCAGEVGEKLMTNNYETHLHNRNTYLNHFTTHGVCPD